MKDTTENGPPTADMRQEGRKAMIRVTWLDGWQEAIWTKGGPSEWDETGWYVGDKYVSDTHITHHAKSLEPPPSP